MDTIKIEGGQCLKGEIKIPPSKSLSHRAIIAAGLSEGCIVDNIIDSQDIKATISCMKQLGAQFTKKDMAYHIEGAAQPIELKGYNFYCHESGSTLRFMIPIAMLADSEVVFHGEGKLTTRPLDPYFNVFKEQSLAYEYLDALPLKVAGSLKSGLFQLPGDISSQFITGLLYALPLLDGDSIIEITSNLESKGYVDLTLDVLDAFGIKIKNDNYKRFLIQGNQKYKGTDYRVEGDYSQIAFWIVAGLLNGDINCLDMRKDSSQGDKEVLDIVKRMQGNITVEDDGIQVKKSALVPTIIDGSQCPDIIPVLTVLAAVTPGETRIINAERLRIKECDRLKAISTELNKLGADIEELQDGLIVRGKSKLKGGIVEGWNDHRIVMSMAVASLVCEEPVIIKGCEAINKSYPHFFEDFKMLGGKFSEWDLEK